MYWYKKYFISISVTLFLISYSQLSLAWNFIGHAVIAEIAYQHLTPQAKQHVDQLVVTFSQVYPETNSYEKMASWPDAIKQDGMNEFSQWHFIDKPFSPDGSHLPYYSEDNVVWAINQTEDSLHTTKNPFNKALSLAFLTHFVGDITQPLHCSNRITRKHPKGDQGGNLYLIKSPYATNLHDFWDKGLGLFFYSPNTNVKTQINNLATTIQTQYPPQYFNKVLLDNNPKHWANHSFDTAKYFVYSTPEHQTPSDTYIKKGQEIVMQQTALAGYRLATILNQIFS